MGRIVNIKRKVVRAFHRVAAMPGKLRVYGKKGRGGVPEVFHELSASPERKKKTGSPNKTKNGTRLRSPLKSISRNVNRTLRERRRAEELDRLVQLQIECTALAERCETNEGKAFKAEIASTRNELRGRVMEEFRDVMEKRHRRLAVQVFNQPATASLADVEKPEMLDRRFKETLELLDKLDFLGSSELQELHRLKNVRNLTGAAPRVRKNNDGTVKPSNQVPTAGPAVSESVNMSSLDRRVKQLQDQVTQLKLESAKQNAKGSSKNIKEVALRKWKGKAKALSTTPDQTSTAGPAALRKGKGKVGILSPIQDHIPTAGPVALTKGKGKAKDLSTAQDQTSIAGLAAQKRANAKAKALSRLQDQISFAGPVPSRSATKADAETIKYLKPLLAVAKGRLDDEPICSFNNWATKLDERYDFVKLAEGSFGEVFRMVQKSNGAIIPGLDDTVFKLIRLRSQKGIGSRSGVPISEAVSEIEVLTKLTEVPGFTQFREAYITQGTYPPQLVKARASYKRKPKTSTGALPGPDKARATQLWVVIEMQYAGTCLSRLKVSSHWHQWDVFWGVAIALARAEQFARFEHRDLHLGNICVKFRGGRDVDNEGPLEMSGKEAKEVKLGLTGLTVTIIDYTLSRADIEPGRAAYIDLEHLGGMFDQAGDIQADTYRLMLREVHRSEPGRVAGWASHHPRTNLLWLHYVLATRSKLPEQPSTRRRRMLSPEGRAEEVGESLDQRLSFVQQMLDDMILRQYGLTSAGDLVQYAIGQGWLDESDVSS